MLWTVKKHFENGIIVNELVHSDEPIIIEPIKDKITSSIVSRHVYKVEHNISPTLHISDIDGKKYIIPMWVEVHPETTMNDIKWTRPKEKKIISEVKGSMGVYKTTYDPNKKIYKCTCMGYFRAKDRCCKHIKALKEKQCQ